MNILQRNTFLMLLIIVPQTASSINVCDDIYLSCHDQDQLVITSINATTRIAKTILEQCNSKGDCKVLNPKKECVQLEHGCRRKMQTVEIKETSHFYQDVQSSSLSLMSFGYHEGKYMQAQQLNCTLMFSQNTKIKVIKNEFAPYTVTKDFCFKVEGSKKQPFCSGSAMLTEDYGIFDENTLWRFSMGLAAGAKQVPKVRFWINIVQSNSNFSLECRTEPVLIIDGHLRFYIYIYALIVGVSLLTLVIIGFIFSQNTCKRARSTRKPPDESDHHDYTYIDIADRSNATGSTAMSRIPSHPNILGETGHLNQPSRIQQFELPPLPREEQREIKEDLGTNDGYLSPRVQHRILSPPSTIEVNLNQSLRDIAPHLTQQLEFSPGPSSLREPETDDTGHCNNNEDEEEAPNNLIENEYFGLSQETRNESIANPRSSVTKLYTLLEGKPRKPMM